MFVQGDQIRDYVFPLAAVEMRSGKAHFDSLLGTGFLIGAGGAALTAAHVLPDSAGSISALFAGDQGWERSRIEWFEKHPTEDVAVLQLSGGPWKSFLRLSPGADYASMHYMLWGYPTDVLFEAIRDGRASPRPDLIYSEGHVRRRLAHPGLPKLSGSLLFELSQSAGSGCSGSPLVRLPTTTGTWPVVGIYIGERKSDDVHLGYAAVGEAFRHWVPTMLGNSLFDESQRAVEP